VVALSAHFCESIGVERWPGDAKRWFLRMDQCWMPLFGTKHYPVFQHCILLVK